MSTYSQDCNNVRSINAKSQQSPLDKRNNEQQRNIGSGPSKKSTIIKPNQPNQTGTKTNPNKPAQDNHNQWKAKSSDERNCSAPNRNA